MKQCHERLHMFWLEMLALLENLNFCGWVFFSVVRCLVWLEMQVHAGEVPVQLFNETKVRVQVQMFLRL